MSHGVDILGEGRNKGASGGHAEKRGLSRAGAKRWLGTAILGRLFREQLP